MPSTDKQEKIDKLCKQIAVCRRCALCETRTNAVSGEGSANANIMFIGEAPGRNEDQQGKPFVGRAGSIFDRLLESAGLTREEIYLCNILKCRPPKNRNPTASAIQSCIGSLDLQIKIVNPGIIATLGNFATTYIFEKFSLPPSKISDVHGKLFEVKTPFGDKKVISLYHPAVATYNSSKIDILLKDFAIFKKDL